MASVNLSGLLSGIDTSSIVEQLMAIESRTLKAYQARQEKWQAKEDALGELEDLLATLQTATEKLYNYDSLRAFNASSSDEDVITASASSSSYEGSHTIEVNQLATAERMVHSAGVEYEEDYVGEGTFIYSYNNVETSVTTTSTTTLAELVDMINNDANNPGVTASTLYYNDAYHVVLNGNDAGSDYSISLNSSYTEVWQSTSEFTVSGVNAASSTLLTDLDDDQFDGTLTGDEVIHITGTDHNGNAITQVDLTVTSNTKISHIVSEINDAFAGVAVARYENGEIILTDLESGASSMSIALNYSDDDSSSTLTLPSMNVSTEGGGTVTALSGFEADDFETTQAAQDSQIRVDGYPSGDWISRSSNTVDDVISGVTLHLHDTGTVSISLTRDLETIKNKIDSMVSAYNEVVKCIAEQTGYDETTKEAGPLQSDYFVNNIKTQIRESLISRTDGFVVDLDTFHIPSLIGLELDKDGLLEFDSTAFEGAIAEDYLGVLQLIGSDKTGSTNSSKIEFYEASTDYTTAGTYDVQVAYDASGNATSVKIKLEGESEYREMTIVGNVAIGNSTFSNGNPAYAENGLAVTFATTGTPSSTTDATLYVKQGFSGAMLDALDNILKYSTGSLQIDQKRASDQIDYLQDKIDDEEKRLDTRKGRLSAKYARLEKQLALIQSQQAALGIG